jgi:hypothetical protein
MSSPGSKKKVLEDSVSSQDLFLINDTFYVSLHDGRGKQALKRLFYTSAIPFLRAEPHDLIAFQRSHL